MKKFSLPLERADGWILECPFTDAVFYVQFWDTHQEVRGKRRMCAAVFQQVKEFPNTFHHVLKTREYYPSVMISCDGDEAAKHLIDFLELDDIVSDELECYSVEEFGEIFLRFS